jgi:hypothetical protein
MARKVPSVEISEQACATFNVGLRAAKQQGKQFVIVRCSDSTIVESCSGKSRFPTRRAALCAASHTLDRIAWQSRAGIEAMNAAKELARRGGSLGPRWQRILLHAVITAGIIEIHEV